MQSLEEFVNLHLYLKAYEENMTPSERHEFECYLLGALSVQVGLSAWRSALESAERCFKTSPERNKKNG